MNKKCSKCLEIKEYSEFYKSSSTKDNYSYVCKNCESIRKSGKPYGSKRELIKSLEFSNNTKYCTSCNIIKNRDNFRSRSLTTLSSQCRECTKLKKIEKDFNITKEIYLEMVENQNNLCKICNKPETFRNRLSIDHSHETLKVRGLLCNKCNTALGLFIDNIETLESAIKYLKHN